MSGVATVYKWELLKLRAQKRTYLGLGAAMLVPIIFVVALAVKGGQGGPTDIPIGRYIRDTGLATPFVVLFFMSIWAFPLITALVAGDVVASESHNDTLKTILTRSRERGEIFTGKLLAAFTYALAAVLVMGIFGTVAGTIEWGFKPLTSLSGTQVPALHGLGLLARASAIYALSLLAIASFGVLLSTVTRNSAASVVGTLMFALLMQVLARASRDGVDQAVPAERAVLGLARLPARARGPRARSCARSGCARSTSRSRSSRRTSSSCAATSRAPERA